MQASLLSSSAACASGRLAAPRPAAGRSGRATLVVRAAQPPKGVTVPKVVPKQLPPTFGFVEYAEKVNSRAAMLGFIGIMVVEAVAGQGIFNLLGVATGKGLDLGF